MILVMLMKRKLREWFEYLADVVETIASALSFH